MKIKYHKRFLKRYYRLPLNLRVLVESKIERFRANPFDPSLRNHALKGYSIETRSFSVTHDMRVVYETCDDHVTVLFLDLGTHNVVY